MRKNMGIVDRMLRFVIGAVMLIVYFTGGVAGVVGVAIAVAGAVFVLTSLVSWCPGYVPMGISTRKDTNDPSSTA
jgi:hypothetical protein